MTYRSSATSRSSPDSSAQLESPEAFLRKTLRTLTVRGSVDILLRRTVFVAPASRRLFSSVPSQRKIATQRPALHNLACLVGYFEASRRCSGGGMSPGATARPSSRPLHQHGLAVCLVPCQPDCGRNWAQKGRRAMAMQSESRTPGPPSRKVYVPACPTCPELRARFALCLHLRNRGKLAEGADPSRRRTDRALASRGAIPSDHSGLSGAVPGHFGRPHPLRDLEALACNSSPVHPCELKTTQLVENKGWASSQPGTLRQVPPRCPTGPIRPARHARIDISQTVERRHLICRR
jgi:hypothetical protein